MFSYGFRQEASYGNSSEKFNRINQERNVKNALARTAKINDITSAVATNAAVDPVQRQVEDVGKQTIGVAAIDTDKVRAVGKSAQVLAKQAGPVVLDALDSFDRAVLQPSGGSVMRSVMNMSQADRAAESATSAATEGVGDILRAGGAASKAAATTSSKLIGGAASGLSVGLGAIDLIQDVASGKIQGDNPAERDSNIETIAAGALETAGLTLDSSVIGIPAGIALNLAGAAVGVISGISELVGQSEAKSDSEKAVAKAKSEQVVKLPELAIPDAASGAGAVIRNITKNVSGGSSVY
tara:strand:+ start:76 stop:966 length:891 start_codon:yes stop_codon:yes gene_type:complete